MFPHFTCPLQGDPSVLISNLLSDRVTVSWGVNRMLHFGGLEPIRRVNSNGQESATGGGLLCELSWLAFYAASLTIGERPNDPQWYALETIAEAGLRIMARNPDYPVPATVRPMNFQDYDACKVWFTVNGTDFVCQLMEDDEPSNRPCYIIALQSDD